MTTERLSHSHKTTDGQVIVLGGVSGTGKSTIGKVLADHLSWRFIEGDDFHPAENIAKMQRNEPLNDADREPWLYRLQDEIRDCLTQGYSAVLACSALKARYRSILCIDPQRVHFVFLTGGRDILHQRLSQRTRHFMGPDLLESQLATLELPEYGLTIDIDQPITAIVQSIVTWLASRETE
jgi:gluconokinase